MNKKVLVFSIIAIFALSFINFCNATDIVMDLNSSANSSSNPRDNTIVTDNTPETPVDNTIYSPDTDTQPIDTDYNEQETTVTTTTEYEESGDLTISNMINIILIVVGIVLILLGIAIIIKLK